MATPTPLQAHLLKAVQNLAYDNHQALQRARHAGHTNPPPEVLAHLDISDRSREQLEEVGLAVGVPKAWIDYARAAGERGNPWQPGQVMLGSRQVERGALIAALGRDIHHLQDMAGVAASSRHEEADSDQVARFRRVMGMTWQRLGAVAHALSLTVEERHQVWQRGHQHWSTAVAAQFPDHSAGQLAARWNEVAGSDFTAVAMPVIVLQAAGITHDDIAAQMPVSPDRMVELVVGALTAADERSPVLPLLTDPARASEAAGINAAIEAAGLTGDPPTAVEAAEGMTAPEPATACRDVDHGHEP